MTIPGLITHKTRFSPKDTMDRLVAAIEARGITVFARVDHAAGAATVGMELRPTAVVIFGNPKAGTPLMQVNQTIGIDLPLKVLVWQDEAAATWIGYDDPATLAERHGIAPTTPAIAALRTVLEALVEPLTT